MLELVSSGLLSVWLETMGVRLSAADAVELLAGPAIPGVVLAEFPDTGTQRQVLQYLQRLAAQGLLEDAQGVWVQSNHQLLASNQGTIPRPAASITKVATSLASLQTWGINHQFETAIGMMGSIQDGILQGDLVITGGGDPLFVWEEAIALGNTLNQMGIRRVTGNLVIAGNFQMNFYSNPDVSGQMLKEALDSSLWTQEPVLVYSKMAPGTPKPQVAIAGNLVISNKPIPKQTLLVRHRSLPLVELLKVMNIYSNNEMAEMLAEAVGGPQKVREVAAKAARVPISEIQLINGSGLGTENMISPRAACGMFMAIQQYLQPHEMILADLFPVSGRDGGTMDYRSIPKGAVVKTGSLWDVSALAGVLPTRDKGWIWFAIMNRGDYLEGFREEQDKLLQQLLEEWRTSLNSPPGIKTVSSRTLDDLRLGSVGRNEILYQFGG